MRHTCFVSDDPGSVFTRVVRIHMARSENDTTYEVAEPIKLTFGEPIDAVAVGETDPTPWLELPEDVARELFNALAIRFRDTHREAKLERELDKAERRFDLLLRGLAAMDRTPR